MRLSRWLRLCGPNLVLLVLTTAPWLAAGAKDVTVGSPDERVHAFYYSWYGNPKSDGTWSNWNHPIVLREGSGGQYTPPDNIGANFYPARGPYSSNNHRDVATHMIQLRKAGVGTIAVTWWGIGSYTDKSLEVVMNKAAKHGIKVCFHLEPFPGRSAATTREAVVHLLDKYGSHPALYRNPEKGNLPMFYVYDSYLVPAEEWGTILAPDGSETLRGTPYDAVFIGLWVKENEGAYMEEGHFDGFYTYFATEGFTYGSTPANWPCLAKWASDHDKIFIPSVGPGYDDTRIRPWNTANQRDRENGAYYDRMWQAALEVDPSIVSITSFNEWHEGTQIEPATPMQIKGYKYLDYGDRDPDWYLERTRHWVERFESR